MEKIIVEAYVPIIPDFEFIKFPFGQRRLVIDEILTVIEEVKFNEAPFIKGHKFTLKEVNELPDTLPKVYFKDFSFLFGTDSAFLNFTLELEVKLSEVSGYSYPDNREVSNFDPKYMAWHFGAELLSKKVFAIIAASQIARPGSLALRGGVVTVQNIKYTNIPSVPDFRIAYEGILEKGYPPIEFLEFPKLWKWIIDNNLLFVSKPNNKFQLAINAFSHLFDSDGVTDILVYSMLALEALYVEGKNDITRQLNQRIQIFLGQIKGYKKQLNQMYDIRSKFFHGEHPLKPKFIENGLEHEYELLLEESATLGMMILIATLQKMYLNNMCEIKFELKLKIEL